MTVKVIAALLTISSNVKEPSTSKRKLLGIVDKSILLYAASILKQLEKSKN